MTEMQLSDDILKQMNIKEIEGCSTSIKFDEKGTLHVQQRDSDGALKRTTPIKESHGDVCSTLSMNQEEQEELDRMRELNKKSNAVGTFAIIMLGLISVGAVVFALTVLV